MSKLGDLFFLFVSTLMLIIVLIGLVGKLVGVETDMHVFTLIFLTTFTFVVWVDCLLDYARHFK